MLLYKNRTYISKFLIIFLLLPHIPFISNVLSDASVVTAIYYTVIFILIYGFLPRLYVPRRLSQRDELLGYALFGAFGYLAISFMLGVFLSELKSSPYDLSPMGIVINVLTVLPKVLAVEHIREYVMAAEHKDGTNIKLLAVIITVMIALTEINFLKLSTLKENQEYFIYIVKDVLPVFAKSALCTVLVIYGGAKASSLYCLITSLFLRLFPFLPELSWLLDSAIGLGFPILFLLYVHESFDSTSNAKAREVDKSAPLFNIALVFVIILAWFSVGVFPIYPSVILTGSMEPLIKPGDMIIIEKISKEEDIYALEAGDIINFDRDKINITHRIMRIEEDEAGNRSFVTKGDNNNAEDDGFVSPNDVNGKIIYNIKYIGIPALLLRSGERIPEGVVDNNAK